MRKLTGKGRDNIKIGNHPLIYISKLGKHAKWSGQMQNIENAFGSSHHGTVEMNPTRNREVAGSIPGLT